MSLLDSRQPILDWFAHAQRDLPWRRIRDPWLILMSESMLQQTQVGRVESRWDEFVERFPTPKECAQAPVAELLSMWSGLGFNRRAMNLHRCATEIVERFDGHVPSGLDDLLSLPGVGPYTARAVRVFAFEEDDAVLDTNVARILARVSGRRLTRSEAQRFADEATPTGDAWRWNQALLDLGATVCTSKRPGCGDCPAGSRCAWRRDRSLPDPAQGSAGVSTPQSTFEGSDRQGRGRLISALTQAPVGNDELAAVMGWPDDVERARTVAAKLVAEGMVVEAEGRFGLPL